MRVGPNALQGIVIRWRLPAEYGFLRGPKDKAFFALRGKRWEAWKTFFGAAGVGLVKACSKATHWHRQCERTMDCGAILPSYVHALGPFCSCC